MIIKDIHVKVNKPGPLMNIYVMPDCHFGSPAFMEEEYDRLASTIEKDPLACLIFQGDLLDSNRPSTRAFKKVAYAERPEEQQQEDERNDLWIKHKIMPRLHRLIKDKSRCLGMMDGDHYMRMENGLSSTQSICAQMGIPYLGDGQAMLRFRFDYLGGTVRTLQMHVQHGLGGAGRAGSGVNRLEDMANIWDGVDIFIRGHSHKGFIFPVSKYYIPQKGHEIKQRDIWLVNTPSFRTGILAGRTDYAEKENYSATAHKFPVLHLSARRTHDDFLINITGELL